MRRFGFNEAGAINPGKPKRRQLTPPACLRASMRPGRLTPENWIKAVSGSMPALSFNEAGAINPGKQHRRFRLRRRRVRFNEAGAINPGKLRDGANDSYKRMSFNEAGAINPGKQARQLTGMQVLNSLQ